MFQFVTELVMLVEGEGGDPIGGGKVNSISLGLWRL